MKWIKALQSSLTGKQAEQHAANYLTHQGLTLLTQNYRCKTGEIDLVMQQNQMLVFVEVKFRKSQSHGYAQEYFHPAKRKKFESAVAHYLHDKKLNPAMVDYRVDVVAIHGEKVEWFQGV
ncbi:YraN family protein [Neptunicella marina]|uniref:YraN family protein n=1 Tax=Neptunicella marina TaxID=2125989 RepID=UPI001F50DA9F|nr:YraN family protein [Neptunicella marina]